MSEPTSEDNTRFLTWKVLALTVLLLLLTGIGDSPSFVVGQFIGLLGFVLVVKMVLKRVGLLS